MGDPRVTPVLTPSFPTLRLSDRFGGGAGGVQSRHPAADPVPVLATVLRRRLSSIRAESRLRHWQSRAERAGGAQPSRGSKTSFGFGSRGSGWMSAMPAIARSPSSVSCDQRPSVAGNAASRRAEEHTSELHSLMRHSNAGFCLKKKQYKTQ